MVERTLVRFVSCPGGHLFARVIDPPNLPEKTVHKSCVGEHRVREKKQRDAQMSVSLRYQAPNRV